MLQLIQPRKIVTTRHLIIGLAVLLMILAVVVVAAAFGAHFGGLLHFGAMHYEHITRHLKAMHYEGPAGHGEGWT
jgi:hypothetical protein